MMRSPIRHLPALIVLLLLPVGAALAVWAADKGEPALDFDRDVRPILAENCFTCHGFDPNKRMASLRLDQPEVALKPLPSGKTALVPGKPNDSELVARITAKDDSRMPPDGSGKNLTDAQVAVLIRWVEQGARYAPH